MENARIANSAQPKPRRRWYQLRLRTLLIGLAVLAVIFHVGQQWWIIQDRVWVWAQVNQLGGKEGPGGFESSPLPRIRQWLGDIPRRTIELPESATENDVAIIQDAFPEAHVLRVPGVRLNNQSRRRAP